MNLGQPAGLYSVDVNDCNVEIPPMPDQNNGMDWAKQYEERKRINRFGRRSSKNSPISLSKAFHQCGNDCDHHIRADANPSKPKFVKEGRIESSKS